MKLKIILITIIIITIISIIIYFYIKTKNDYADIKNHIDKKFDENFEKIKNFNNDCISQVRKMNLIQNEPIRKSNYYTENDNDSDSDINNNQGAMKYLSDSTLDKKNDSYFYMSQDDRNSKINFSNSVQEPVVLIMQDNNIDLKKNKIYHNILKNSIFENINDQHNIYVNNSNNLDASSDNNNNNDFEVINDLNQNVDNADINNQNIIKKR